MPLILYPNSQLHLTEDGDPRDYRDVAFCAHQYLHEPLIADAVLLSDLLGLLSVDPILKSIFKNQNAIEIERRTRQYLADTSNQLTPGAAGVLGADDAPFDYLELAPEWLYNSHNNRYYGVQPLSLLGVAAPTPELLHALGEENFNDLIDPYDQQVKQRIGLVPLPDILNLPLVVTRRLPICEGDPASTNYMMVLKVAELNSITLGEVLFSVLAELSAYGADADIVNMRDSIVDSIFTGDVADVLGAPVVEPLPVPGHYYDLEMFGALSAVLESFHGISPLEIKAFLRDLPDTDIASKALVMEFGDGLIVRHQFLELTAREFRRKLLQGVKD